MPTASSEKPVGERDRVEITVRDKTPSSRVNGVLQNSGVGFYSEAGQNCYQSEGGPIKFSSITIDPHP